MSGSSLRVIGIIGIVAGICLLLFGATMESGRLLFAGGVFVVGGAFRIMRGARFDATATALPDDDDPRWQPNEKPQIAGRKCAECGTKITMSGEGDACPICSEPAHLRCLDAHRAHAHRPKGLDVGPFR